MENPIEEVSTLVHTLTQATPTKQKDAVYRYFTPSASFTHPFCATGSWSLDLPFLGTLDSRWATLQIYQWYKIMSPRIDLEVLSVTFNEDTLKLYVDMHQHFRLWIVPFYDASVYLTTVLQLVKGDASGPDSALQRRAPKTPSEKPWSYAAVADPDRPENGEIKTVYYITSQNDLYQTSEFIKFLVPWGVGNTLMEAWMLFATFLSILGSFLLFPSTWWKERSVADLPRKI